MTLNTSKCNHLTPLHFKGLIAKIVELSISVQGSVCTRRGRQHVGGSDAIVTRRRPRVAETGTAGGDAPRAAES